MLKFCYVPATSAASFKGIFVAATNSTNWTNKAIRQSIFLICIRVGVTNPQQSSVGWL